MARRRTTPGERFPAAVPGLAGKRASLSAAINRCYASFDDHLAEGDELVFIPPVSGG